MIKITHNGGLFSCCSLRLHDIVRFINYHKMTPIKVNTAEQFKFYKNNHKNDITFEYFEDYNITEPIIYTNRINYQENFQYINYKILDYPSICPVVKKYFTPSVQINNLIETLENKYIKNYNDICVLFYRGNDKITETGLSSYSDNIEKAKEVLRNNPNIQFLIQSDETEFIETMTKEFPSNSFYFKDEIRHMNKQSRTVDKVFKDSFKFSQYYLAITIIMSKCNYVICGSSGNCSIWIMFYRGNSDNVYQFLNDKWLEP